MPDTARHTARPPRLALWLLATLLPSDEREHVIGDLVELFETSAATNGRVGASLAFWRHALGTLLTLRATDASPAARPVPDGSGLAPWLGDLRHAARVLRRAPTFTAACVLTLGLAIGAATAIFSIVDPILFRPLPYPDASRLAFVWERSRDGARENVGFETYADLAADSAVFASAAAVGGWSPILAGDGAAEKVAGERVSWRYFRTLGVAPALGRDFVAADDTTGRNQVVVLSHGLWQRRYGGDPAVVGRAITVNGGPMTVVGVMPAGFDNVIGADAEIWRVLGYARTDPYACRSCRHLRMLARLAPGVTRERAEALLDTRFARVRADHAKDYASVGVLVPRLQDEVTGRARPALLAVLGAVLLLLLIAVTNVANLQLARSMRRESEFAVRTALGAGRRRLVQQMAAEGVVLAALAGAAGVAVASLALPSLVARLPEGLPRVSAIQLDGVILAAVAGATLVIGLAVGVLPVWWRGARTNAAALRGGARLAGGGRRVAQSTIVIAEVALTLVLLTAAGLVARSLVLLLAVDAGFDTTHLLAMQVAATGNGYGDNASIFAYHDRVRDAVRAVPGVVNVGVTNQLPLSGNVDRMGVRAADVPLDNPELAPAADLYAVSTDFLPTMRVPLLGGRTFDARDAADSAAPVAMVSRSLAARIWPGQDAVGKRVQMGEPTQPWFVVIGVVGDVHHEALDAATNMQIYVPERRWIRGASAEIALVVRTRDDPASMASRVRGAVLSVDQSQPIYELTTMDRLVSASTAQRRLSLVLFSAFGLAALALAAAGLYGVIAGNVAERVREIGVRTALGARPADVARLVVRRGLALTALGAAVGLVGALALSRFVRSLLFGITPTDPLTLGTVVLVLGATACAACLVPVVRAMHVDPTTALREQ